MFLILCGAGLAVWENRHDLTYEPANVVLEAQVRERIHDEILQTLDTEDCFLGLRGNVNWRPREGRYRLDIELSEGSSCESRARGLCSKVAQIIRQRTGREATVIAFDPAGREMGRAVL